MKESALMDVQLIFGTILREISAVDAMLPAWNVMQDQFQAAQNVSLIDLLKMAPALARAPTENTEIRMEPA